MSHEIWTIGHSTRALPDFLALLAESNVGRVADVRRFPGSRRHPQYQQAALSASLAEAGIEYRHVPQLGGRRTSHPRDSPNTAWRVEAFNAFADHLLTPEGREGLAQLMSDGRADRTVILCAEAVPWRCHRRVIADALTARDWTVWDILGPHKVDRHALTAFARVRPDGDVIYPGLFTAGGGSADATTSENDPG